MKRATFRSLSALIAAICSALLFMMPCIQALAETTEPTVYTDEAETVDNDAAPDASGTEDIEEAPAAEPSESDMTPAAAESSESDMTPAAAEPSESDIAADAADAEAAEETEEAGAVTEEVFTAETVPGQAEEPVGQPLPMEQQFAEFGSDVFSELPDSETLFGSYFDRLCYEETAGSHQFTSEALFASRRSALTGMNLYIYDQLLLQIKQVASGSRTNTVFNVSLKEFYNVSDSYYGYYTDPANLGLPSGITYDELASRLGFNMTAVFSALLYDCSYDLYWYDKVTGGNFGYPFQVQNGMVGYQSSITVSFYVAQSYSASGTTGTTATSASRCSAASNAVNTAKQYVSNAAGMSDVEKIRYYYRTVWSLSTYNYEAATMNPVIYGDPWQVIYVFDNDPSTTVVCEGYAKAYKLLCDLTSFNDPLFECYVVSGNLVSSGANGSHMWNIVRLDDGRYYLADITNDADAEFDIPGYSAALNNGYRYGDLSYYYDSRMTSMYVNGELVMSPYAYSGKASAVIPVTGVQLDLGADSTIYVSAGTPYTLQVRIQPEDATNKSVTFSSSDPSVAAVDAAGRISGLKSGTASVTVRTSDGGKTAACTVVVTVGVTGVTLNTASASMKAGSVLQLQASVLPAAASNQNVTWSSNNTAVATVSSTGLVTAKAVGTAVITVRTDEGGKTASCTVTVWQDGWRLENGNYYWYENGVKQGTTGRGKEIYFSGAAELSNPGHFGAGWYWLDAVQGGARAVSKDVYQESEAGVWSENANGIGKWVRYDANGNMIKGWHTVSGRTWYFDLTYGTMAKGYATIEGTEYYFDIGTGVLQRNLGKVPRMGWKRVDGKDYWYENYCRQGVSNVSGYRGKEIYFSGQYGIDNPGGLPAGWYWLDSIYGGAKAADKEVYMPYTINGRDNIGKWVRYDSTGQMIKGWYTISGRRYYYDPITGAMYKGVRTINGSTYVFDDQTGVLMQ